MFAILFPICAIPIIGILLWSQVRAKKSGLVHSTNPYEEVQVRGAVAKLPLGKQLAVWSREMDAIGLLLFTAGWTCVSTSQYLLRLSFWLISIAFVAPSASYFG
jgi:hypothetical protein